MRTLVSTMERALDGAWQRHEILAANLANAETPGYKRRDLDFLSQLAESQMKLTPLATHPLHLTHGESGAFKAFTSPESVTQCGNGVDMDKEMAEVATNSLYYAAISRNLSGYLSLLRKAITEGRR